MFVLFTDDKEQTVRGTDLNVALMAPITSGIFISLPFTLLSPDTMNQKYIHTLTMNEIHTPSYQP